MQQPAVQGTRCSLLIVRLCELDHYQASYDMDELESKLIDALQRKMMAYSLQDLACHKCRQVELTIATNFKSNDTLILCIVGDPVQHVAAVWLCR